MGAVASRAVGAFHRVVMRRVGDREWRGQAAAVVASLGLMIFSVRVLGAGWPGKFRIFFPDSFSFLNVARHTPFSPRFYVAERPIAFPTLLFLLGRSTVVTVVVQTLLYGIVTIAAAAAVWRTLRQTEARIIAAFLVITVSLQPRFALWTTHILSESVGMTLGTASVVAWWLFSAEPTRRRANWAGIATVFWLTARDANVPPWLMVGVPSLLLSSWLWRSADPALRRTLRRWGIVTLVVCIGVTASQAANGRNRYATINNVGTRVLPNAELTEWFVDRGMPIDDALRARTGSDSFDNNWDMLTSPELEEFREWADSSGQRVMLLSYARFAPHWLDKLYDDLPLLLSYDQRDYDAFGVAERLPSPAPAQINGPTSRSGLLIWIVLCVGSLVAALFRRGRVQVVVLAALLLSSFVDLYMAYVGDSVEVLRHMVGPLSRMALVMVLIAATGFDSLIELIFPSRRYNEGNFAETFASQDVVGEDVAGDASSDDRASDRIDSPASSRPVPAS